ncbi:hypothetical protein IVB15_17095 [Bradyrhizobium sp. 182]|uniref:hypothetical protein n=1 Tax=unclassified Bradyrhizobium TaxID=2631580 RepID=UPI001FFBBBC0|nr:MULTISPECIES: hypothetical protein [unclassified Bradyrhizobium]MCK1423021.1 hypothetical protein [Bradyrhizobium sp. CW12]MCK1529388.1 hypothetical protein [Bradyrhizobium sp. 182]MCK1643788.1 hypothetical protein [Bradyrhizobium sp. 154]
MVISYFGHERTRPTSQGRSAPKPSCLEEALSVVACDTQPKAIGLNVGGRTDVVLAGWSDNTGPSIFVTECHLDHDFFKGSAVERYITPSVEGLSEMQFPDDGLPLLEKQHNARFSRTDAGTFGAVTIGGLVGGFAQHTQVDAGGIKIEVLMRWPDEIVGGAPA